MIHTDQRGQAIFDELKKLEKDPVWSDYESTFLSHMIHGKYEYKSMTPRQKHMIDSLYDKWLRPERSWKK